MEKTFKTHEMGTYGNLTETHKRDESSQNSSYKVPKGDELHNAFSIVISFT